MASSTDTPTKGTVLTCMSPYSELMISELGFVAVACCNFRGMPLAKVDPQGPIKLAELWNSDRFRKLRTHFADQDFADSGCQKCALLRPVEEMTYPRPDAMSPAQVTNLETAVAEAGKPAADIDHVPCHYNFVFTAACNMRCIMCSKHISREKITTPDLNADALLANTDMLAKAHTVNVTGGEPILSEECRKFIKGFCEDSRLDDVRLSILSNGSLLHTVMDHLRTRELLTVSVSLDGIKDTYEAVRVGGSWSRVSSNVQALVDARDELGRDQWRLRCSMVLLKTSVGNIDEFTKWCLDRRIEPTFGVLVPTRETTSEDIIRNRNLLEEIPGWDTKLQRAADLCREGGWPNSAATLDSFRERLHVPPTEADLACMPKDSTEELSPEALYGKRVLIWGTGSHYRYCFEDWLRDNVSAFTFLGFVDNDADRWGQTCDNYPIHSAEQAEALKPDVIIIAVNTLWRNDIIEQINGTAMRDAVIW